jgi:hypothetical protein
MGMAYRHGIISLVFMMFLTVVPLAAAQDACAESACVEVAAVPADVINEHPAPEVVQLAPDEEILTDRSYRQVLQAVDVYDAPNGNIVGTLAAGFNFVTAGADENGWTRINPNEYVHSEFLGRANVSRFSGVLLPEEDLPYPVGWMLVNTVPSRTPGAEPLDSDLPLLRYERVYLYTSAEADGWTWYQVGTDQWIHQTLIAKILPVKRPDEVDTKRWVSVDLYEQVAIAYEDETPVFATLVSSGLPEWSTNEGLFHIYVRYDRTVMSGADGQSDFYYLEEVPWTMYFDDDIGLHGTYWHDGFGYRHSHGCVNLSITDAYWLYNWASDEFDFTVDNDTGAAVYVYSSGNYR